MFDLTGKVAVVTGGVKGIREGIAKRLAQAGAKVLICDFNTDMMKKTVNKLSDMGLEVSGVRVDINDEEDCKSVVKKAV